MDCAALRSTFKITSINGVVDAQGLLFFTENPGARGPFPMKFFQSAIAGGKNTWKSLFLRSLLSAVAQYLPDCTSEFSEEKLKYKFLMDFCRADTWRKRPLTSEDVKYAAGDAVITFLLFNKLEASASPEVLMAMRRCASVCSGLLVTPTEKHDCYMDSSVFPMHVLFPKTGHQIECNACHMKLSCDMFSKVQQSKSDPRCVQCLFTSMLHQQARNRDRSDDYNDCYSSDSDDYNACYSSDADDW